MPKTDARGTKEWEEDRHVYLYLCFVLKALYIFLSTVYRICGGGFLVSSH